MKENDFLFKLGAVLAPAVLLGPSPEAGTLVAIAGALSLFLFHGLTVCAGKIAAFLTRFGAKLGFLGDALGVVLASILATGMNVLAQKFFYGAWFRVGLLFPVVLVHILLLTKEDDLKVKGKLALWFVFGLLVASLGARASFLPARIVPASTFLGIACFLFAVGFFLRRKWWAL